MKLNSGETAVVPLEVTWMKGRKVKASNDYVAELMEASGKWRTANGGKKPTEILFYGNFGESPSDKVYALKDRLGYNTILPDSYKQVRKAVIPQHFGSPDAIRKLASSMPPERKSRVRVISFGDEISLGQIFALPSAPSFDACPYSRASMPSSAFAAMRSKHQKEINKNRYLRLGCVSAIVPSATEIKQAPIVI